MAQMGVVQLGALGWDNGASLSAGTVISSGVLMGRTS